MNHVEPITDFSGNRPPARRARAEIRGFTLVEMMVAVAIMTILILSLGSVVALATKAIPPATPPASDTTATHDALRALASELELASDITVATATKLEFKVADRNSDGSSETICYTWSGSAGDALYRKYNSATAEVFLPSVRALAFTYSTVNATLIGASTSTTSAETLFYSNDTDYNTTQPVASGESYAQTFSPLLPTNATSWKLTRVRYIAAATGTKSGTITLNIRPVTSSTGLPTNAVWATGTKLESALTTSFNWYSFDASAAPSQPPGGAMAFVLSSTDDACQIRLANTGFAQSGAQALFQAQSSPTWVPMSGGSMMVQVYGTYDAPVAATTAVKRVTGVSINVQTTAGGPTVRTIICPRGRPIGVGL